MQIEKLFITIEINDKDIIFLLGKFDEEFHFRERKKLKFKNLKVDENENNINYIQKTLKNGLNQLEKEFEIKFSEVDLILDDMIVESLNLSGFKKLAGSRLVKDDASYLINNLRELVQKKNKNIIHIFNSEFKLDEKVFENFPVGQKGNYYKHSLSLFLIDNKTIDYYKKILSNCSLQIRKINLRYFLQGVDLIQKDNPHTFFVIYIKKEKSYLAFFNKYSFIFFSEFKFGSNIILRDIKKVCIIKTKTVENILNKINFDTISDSDKDKFIEKDLFDSENYKKISKSLVMDVINDRQSEIINLIYKKNVDLEHFKTFDHKIYLNIEDKDSFKNLENSWNKIFKKDNKNLTEIKTQNEISDYCSNSALVNGKGWVKEAIPLIKVKKTLISKIFSSIFK